MKPASDHPSCCKTKGKKNFDLAVQESTKVEKSVSKSESTEVNTTQTRDIDSNVKELTNQYKLTEKCFGENGKKKGRGNLEKALQDNKTPIRIIVSKNQYVTAKEFYERISKGGVSFEIKKPGGKVVIGKKMEDGTIITYREESSTFDSPCVEISKTKSKLIRDQKIHFKGDK